jgi:hypothetical protein
MYSTYCFTLKSINWLNEIRRTTYHEEKLYSRPTSTALIKIMKQISRNFCLRVVPHEAYFNIEEIRFHPRSAEKN